MNIRLEEHFTGERWFDRGRRKKDMNIMSFASEKEEKPPEDNDQIEKKKFEPNDIKLDGCSPIPLAHYLKALGVFRLVAEQKDPDVRGYWKDDRFHIVTRLSKDELIDFFLKEYEPTPVISPWNGGSGFSSKENHEGFNKIRSSNDARFRRVREEMELAFRLRDKMRISEKVNKDQKDELLLRCRNQFSDEALSWLDSTFVFTNDGVSFPPLLGSGGNDGRMEFSKNYLQNIAKLIDMDEGKNVKCLEGALFNRIITDLLKSPIGQFHPSAVGGFNAASGFNSDSVINHWDYILSMEGLMVFSASSSRKIGHIGDSALSYPFSVKPVGTGYGSSAETDGSPSKARSEMWFPIWEKPASYHSIRLMCGEGRSNIGRKTAGNSVDFARSIATLGIDRGINEFFRYGFLVRNGLAYFATPLGRFKVRRQHQVDLLMDIDGWLDQFRRKSSSDQAPSSIKRHSQILDGLIIELCKQKSIRKMQSILIELGMIEMEMSKNGKWTKDTAHLRPIPLLSKRWIEECNDGTPEFRLALSLASIYGKYGKDFRSIRSNLEPISEPISRYPSFRMDEGVDRDVVSTQGSLVGILNRIVARRMIRAEKENCDHYPDRARYYAFPGDIADFIEGEIDDEKLKDLFIGLSLINWWDDHRVSVHGPRERDSISPDSLYIIMKLCYTGSEKHTGKIPLVPGIHRKCASGDGTGALQLATRRLRGSGIVPAVGTAYLGASRSERIAASLLFPVHEDQILKYLDRIGRQRPDNMDDTDAVMEVNI